MNCNRCQAETDGHDHGADDHWWQQAADKAGAPHPNQATQEDVENTCGHQAAQGFFHAKPAFGGEDARKIGICPPVTT